METDYLKMGFSKSHLLFKYLHRIRFPRNFYAFDADLILVSKYPPRVLAIIEFKNQDDVLSFSEVLGFNYLKEAMPGVPIFVIKAQNPFVGADEMLHRFDVYEYLGGDWLPDPPAVSLKHVLTRATWDDLLVWENSIRYASKCEVSARHELRSC